MPCKRAVPTRLSLLVLCDRVGTVPRNSICYWITAMRHLCPPYPSNHCHRAGEGEQHLVLVRPRHDGKADWQTIELRERQTQLRRAERAADGGQRADCSAVPPHGRAPLP